jgi:TonB family protein
MRSARTLLLVCLSASLLTTVCFGSSNEDEAAELLLRSSQQSNLWGQGPIQLVAKVRMLGSGNQGLNLEYTVSWVAPDKWRTEWSGSGYSQVTVLNEGRLYRYRSLPAPPVQVLGLEKALGMALGNTPASPFFTPIAPSKSKTGISKEKIDGVATQCVAAPNIAGTACIDPASSRMLRYHDNNESVFEYADYSTFGGTIFPQLVRIMTQTKQLLGEAKVSVSRPAKFADSLFEPLANADVADFPWCANLEKNVATAHLDKRIQPQYPPIARQSHHQGTVWLYAPVGKDGAIRHLQIIGSASPELDKSAVEAVQQWKYTSYLRCGVPVLFETIITVNYSLSVH